MRKTLCLRCEKEMKYAGSKKLQLGETGWILGDLPNLLAGALEADIYICEECGKIEFFQPEFKEGSIAKVSCPKCGIKHDCDFYKCPVCGYRY